MITQGKSWKVKRIRNTPRVTLAICDMQGHPKSEAIDATATILDASQTGLVYDAIGREYGIVGEGVQPVQQAARRHEEQRRP